MQLFLAGIASTDEYDVPEEDRNIASSLYERWGRVSPKSRKALSPEQLLELIAAKAGQKAPTTNAEQVDRIMEVVKVVFHEFHDNDIFYDLRTRLTKLFA